MAGLVPPPLPVGRRMTGAEALAAMAWIVERLKANPPTEEQWAELMAVAARKIDRGTGSEPPPPPVAGPESESTSLRPSSL